MKVQIKNYKLLSAIILTIVTILVPAQAQAAQAIESATMTTITPTPVIFWDNISARLNNSRVATLTLAIAGAAVYAGYRYYKKITAAPDYIARARERARAARSLQLINAAKDNREDQVRELLADRANLDINSQDEHGMTALMYATQSARINIINLLITAGADVNLRNNRGMTALLISVSLHTIEDQERILPILINARADINLTNNNGSTALMYAADRGHQSIVTLLLANHADIFATNTQGFTALHRARLGQHNAIYNQLIAHILYLSNLTAAAAA